MVDERAREIPDPDLATVGQIAGIGQRRVVPLSLGPVPALDRIGDEQTESEGRAGSGIELCLEGLERGTDHLGRPPTRGRAEEAAVNPESPTADEGHLGGKDRTDAYDRVRLAKQAHNLGEAPLGLLW